MTIRERFGTIELVDDYDCVDLYADFEANAIGTNCADSYYNFTVPMGEFLKFADRIREKLEEQDGQEMTDEPIKDSIINTSQLRHAQVCIDEAINALEAQHNSGIDEGATKILRHVYDWLDATAQMLDDMDEIEQMGEQQRG